MKIKSIEENKLTFDNGYYIECDHYQDCCEWNYADFEQLDDLARNYDFDKNLRFETIDEAGFRFGDSRCMFFVPCYSVQNGYYSHELDIHYYGLNFMNEPVLLYEDHIYCEEDYC